MPETTLYIRVKQALTWLKRNKGILQKDIADKMGITETSFTRGLARIKERNDEDFIIKFHEAVSEYISLDFLLYGKGDIVAVNRQQIITNRAHDIQRSVLGHVVEEQKGNGWIASEDIRPFIPTWADTLLEILSKQIAENEVLHAELKQSISYMNQSMSEVNEMKEQLSVLIEKIK